VYAVLYRTLFVLVTLRLMLPPGICVCKWNSPAARVLVALLATGKDVPLPEPEGRDDDHAPGCPASPFAVGMGLRPASQPPEPPALSFDPLPPTPVPLPDAAPPTPERAVWPSLRPPSPVLYLSHCSLII
jgi:hypothetical protein